jgi:hypothetical protein
MLPTTSALLSANILLFVIKPLTLERRSFEPQRWGGCMEGVLVSTIGFETLPVYFLVGRLCYTIWLSISSALSFSHNVSWLVLGCYFDAGSYFFIQHHTACRCLKVSHAASTSSFLWMTRSAFHTPSCPALGWVLSMRLQTGVL